MGNLTQLSQEERAGLNRNNRGVRGDPGKLRTAVNALRYALKQPGTGQTQFGAEHLPR